MNRGGSWNTQPRNARVANRNRNTPDNRNNNLGLRLASTGSGAPAPVGPMGARHGGRSRAQDLSSSGGPRAQPAGVAPNTPPAAGNRAAGGTG